MQNAAVAAESSADFMAIMQETAAARIGANSERQSRKTGAGVCMS